jgi:hypothetical protein
MKAMKPPRQPKDSQITESTSHGNNRTDTWDMRLAAHTGIPAAVLQLTTTTAAAAARWTGCMLPRVNMD